MSKAQRAIDPWFAQYREYPTSTLEGKIYLAAQCLPNESQAHIENVAIVAYELNVSIWHATWILSDKTKPCECAPCARGRMFPKSDNVF